MTKPRRPDRKSPASVTPLVRDDSSPLQLARALCSVSSDAVLLANADGLVVHANPAATALFAPGGGDLCGHDLRVLVPGCPSELRHERGVRAWTSRVLVATDGLVELDVRLLALDPPRQSVVALVATRRPAAHESTSADSMDMERWALAAHSSADGFWHRPDVALDTAWWSPRLYEMLGYAPGEVEPSYSSLMKRLHPDDRESFLATREQDLLDGIPLDAEVRIRHRSGEYRQFRVRALVTREHEGRPLSLSGSLQDVTQLRLALDCAQTNQARMRDLASAASDFFFEMDQSFTVNWLSENFSQVSGIEREKVIGRSVEARRPEGVQAQDWNRYVETLRRHEPFRDLIHSRERGDGCITYTSLSGYPIFDDDGFFRGYRGSGTDVTLRMQMENALRESEERYRTIVESAHGAVLVLDAEDYRITDANGAAVRLYGISGDQLLNMRATDLAADPGVAKAYLDASRETDAIPFHADMHVRADGNRIPVEVSARSVRLSGRATIVCMVRDVSKHQELVTALRESEARLKALVDNAPLEIYLKDRDGRYLLANARVATAWRLPVEEIIGRTAHDLFEADFADSVVREDSEIRSKHDPIAHEFVAERHGQRVEIARVKFPIPDAQGNTMGIAAISHDVTERNRTLRALESSEKRFRDFANLAADYLWETDQDLRYTFVSERCLSVEGISADELIGKFLYEVFDDHYDDDDSRDKYRESLEAHRPSQAELTRLRPDGTPIRVFISVMPIVDDAGTCVGFRGITRDVTQAHELAARLAFQASHDALTGLVNRAEFERRLEHLLASARRDGSSHALCYLDLDQFKVVNDTCGHMAGDALLERLAETLTFRVRQRDTVARLGGDEFAVLIEHCSLEHATRVTSALHQAIAEFAFTWEDKQFQVGASIGLVPITPGLGDATDVLSAADSACYVAKDQGRNRIHVYAEDDVELTRRRGEMDWVSHISGALAEGRFQLRAQPVVPLSPRHAGAHHCELLVVMLDRDGNEVPPGAFLPAAERYNLATRLDRWVVRAALQWLADDADPRGRPMLTGINLSAQSLVESDFLAYIRGECEHHGVPASRLCFEITETAAIANLEKAQRFMRELRRDGACFALDDFGKGLSSFGYLRSLPVDYIKIDAQFVRDLTTDAVDLAMVRSINEVAHLMHKRTIAEGVETHDVLKVLREIGVNYAQGFALGEPRLI